MKCKNCNKELPKGRTKYCSDNCRYKHYYEENKERCIKKAREWEKKNPKKAKEIHKKANDKYRRNNKRRFNELIKKQYYKDKSKWHSRSRVYTMLKAVNKKIEINQECKKCKSKDNLRLKFKEHPTKTEDIIKAIKDKKIYYLCGDCR